MVKIANFLINWNMPKTHSKIDMNDMVKIDTLDFEIVGWEAFKPPPPPRIVSCLKYPGSDMVKVNDITRFYLAFSYIIYNAKIK